MEALLGIYCLLLGHREERIACIGIWAVLLLLSRLARFLSAADSCTTAADSCTTACYGVSQILGGRVDMRLRARHTNKLILV